MIRKRRGGVIHMYVGQELRHERARSMSPQERWARIALRLMMADCPYRPVLCITPGNPFTDAQLAKHMMVSPIVWKNTKKKLLEWGEIDVDPRVGIRYPDWMSGIKNFYRKSQKVKNASPTLSEQELIEHEDLRTWLIDRYNLITGQAHSTTDTIFVRNVSDRIAEGATREDLDIGMRTYLWVNMNATLRTNSGMVPSRAFVPSMFWKWVKMAMPAPVVRQQSTFDYINSLPKNMRSVARKMVTHYNKEIGLTLRRNGWDNLCDCDFTKVQTCKQYIMDRMERIKSR